MVLQNKNWINKGAPTCGEPIKAGLNHSFVPNGIKILSVKYSLQGGTRVYNSENVKSYAE